MANLPQAENNNPRRLRQPGDILMPLFGAHMSIAGGLHNAIVAGQKYGCQAIQLFTKSCQQWKAKQLTRDEIIAFRRAFRKSGVRLAMAHDCYLINLASPLEALHRQSVEAFIVECLRTEQLGIRYLVTHPGSHLDAGEEVGLARVAKALDEVHDRCPGFRVQVLLEVTAGQGSNLGYRFEHLAKILSLVKEPNRLGVCLDTCHIFAAGYALSPRREYLATMRALTESSA
jgi:deoxyribonuclease-4